MSAIHAPMFAGVSDPDWDKVVFYAPLTDDLSEYRGHTLTAHGGASVTGGYLSTDGVDDYITVAFDGDLAMSTYPDTPQLAKSLTTEFTLNVHDADVTGTLVGFYQAVYPDVGKYGWRFLLNSGRIFWKCYNAAGTEIVSVNVATDLAIDTDHHIAIGLNTSDGTLRCLLNGQRRGSVVSYGANVIETSLASSQFIIGLTQDLPEYAKFKMKHLRITESARYQGDTYSILPTPYPIS
jgi:hypothetical protein